MKIGGKPKKKGEWEINEESLTLRENQVETNKELLRLWESKTSGKRIKGKERSCEGTNEERYAGWEKIVGKESWVWKESGVRLVAVQILKRVRRVIQILKRVRP